MPSSAPREQARYSAADDLGGLEMLHARFIDHRFAPHVHEAYAIAVLEAGAERYRYRGVEHLVTPGAFAVINPDEVHTGQKGVEQGWLYRVFYPQPRLFESLAEELDMRPAGAPLFRDSVYPDSATSAMLCALHRLLQAPRISVLQRQSAWRESVLRLLRRHARWPEARPPGHEPRAVMRARELLASRLADPPSLEALAEAAGLSPFHLVRVFRRATGLPPHAWLRQRRLEQARVLLRRGSSPLETAMVLGFADQSHLTRQFKQAYGIGPGEYRKACMA